MKIEVFTTLPTLHSITFHNDIIPYIPDGLRPIY